MKEYEFSAVIYGKSRIEDTHCPSYWRGSGCYDIDVDVHCHVDGIVAADGEEQAREMIAAYDYTGDARCGVEDQESIEILSVSLCEEESKETDAAVLDGTCYYGDVEGLELMDGPDPDELYERRRDARDND